jgi:membrane protein
MRNLVKFAWRATVRATGHDQFGVAKGVAYSALMTLFPAALLVASVLASMHGALGFVRGVVTALGRILPPGTSSAVLDYFNGTRPHTLRLIVSCFFLTLWTGTGVTASWMDGFRRAYELPENLWSMAKARVVSLELLLMAVLPLAFASVLVAFGRQIEMWMIFHSQHEYGPYILGVWAALRWMIAMLTSIAVITLIYHHGVPRTQPWHRVLPGAVLATVLWYLSTVIFGAYVLHFANYGEIYGSVGTAIALLAWLYMISLVVLVGAEFNALRYPRFPPQETMPVKTEEPPAVE